MQALTWAAQQYTHRGFTCAPDNVPSAKLSLPKQLLLTVFCRSPAGLANVAVAKIAYIAARDHNYAADDVCSLSPLPASGVDGHVLLGSIPGAHPSHQRGRHSRSWLLLLTSCHMLGFKAAAKQGFCALLQSAGSGVNAVAGDVICICVTPSTKVIFVSCLLICHCICDCVSLLHQSASKMCN